MFRYELEKLINQYSIENGSNTPDFMLAGFLNSCLDAFDHAVRERDKWYGVHLSPGNSHFEDAQQDNVEENSSSHNTSIPKFPTWEEVYKWAIDSHGSPDIDQGRYAILRGCYDFIAGNFGFR
jgi:hypothetical protein